MDINLKQASYYELVFPFAINGEPPEELNDVQFEILRGSTSIAQFELGSTASYSDGQIVITIDNPDSLDLRGNYTFELWVTDILNKNLYADGGNITFDRTRVRI